MAGDGKGGVSYFAGGFQNQFGLETQIVAAMCTYCPFYPGLRILVFCRADGVGVRWYLGLRDDLARAQGPAYGGSALAADRSVRLGRSDFGHVQLFAECIQGQEWWISLLVAPVLSLMSILRVRACIGRRMALHQNMGSACRLSR